MAGIEATKRVSGNEAKDTKSDSSDTKSKDHHVPHPATDDEHKTPKKRRKVNHACLYCRRSHMTCDLARPCTRCVKRNIGHLCHDEPRGDHESRKSRSVLAPSTVAESDTQSDLGRSVLEQNANSMGPPAFESSLSSRPAHGTKSAGFDAAALAQGTPLQLVQPTDVSSIHANALNSTLSQFAGFPDSWLGAANHYHDMHNYHTNGQTPIEVTDEFDLLNEFLHQNLLEERGVHMPNDQSQLLGNGQSDSLPGFQSNVGLLPPGAIHAGAMLPPNADYAKTIARPGSAIPTDKTREYYLEAADPQGNATPEERMKGILDTKYKAGLLKPFNYVQGYARLLEYLDKHASASGRAKILSQLAIFRPKFRERMEHRETVDLIMVECWFEKSLLECDRLFASMAIPACCWRRTGEIFRGNKEMAELINVPIESLQGGKIALHQILTEESNVRYWEEFGTIAFDREHDTLITACSLKNPDDESNHPKLNCCFSFRIKRDDHRVPTLIIGNFLPHDP